MTIAKTVKAENVTDILANIIFSGAVAGLSFYLDKKMFPNYNPNKLKKDSNGEYILIQKPTDNKKRADEEIE
jgi:hypothetical protein